jgi:hypothetical protein
MTPKQDLKKEQIKNGMYEEMPSITIGKFRICMMSDRENENRIWVVDEGVDGGEGGEFPSILFEPFIEQAFNKYF